MSSSDDHIEILCRDLCAALAGLGAAVSWSVRLAATTRALQQLTGIAPEIVVVRAAAYSRSAVFRLGGAMVPRHQGEVEHFREQVGPAMTLLGITSRAAHAVLCIEGVIVEVAHGADWGDRGVLLRPFVYAPGRSVDAWIVDGLRYGVSVAYERAGGVELRAPRTTAVDDLARKLCAAVDHVADRASGE
jgi:hypothetical protein